MSVKKIAKIAVLMALTALTSSCLEKADNLSSDTKNASNSVWQWDDQQKSWLYNGSLYTAKFDNSTTPLWKKQENSIVLQIESVKSLTNFDSAPKALQMKIFQLSDPKAFLQAATSSSGLKHLLTTEQIDPAVVGMERLFVLPGISQTINLDRKEKARYIGVVLGYASLNQEKISRLVPIVVLDDEDSEGKSSKFPSLLASINSDSAQNTQKEKNSLRPAVLKMNLVLEANGINKLAVDVK